MPLSLSLGSVVEGTEAGRPGVPRGLASPARQAYTPTQSSYSKGVERLNGQRWQGSRLWTGSAITLQGFSIALHSTARGSRPVLLCLTKEGVDQVAM